MANETQAKAGDVFHCPTCGQRHRADLTPLRLGKTSAMRTLCAGCRRVIVVEWKDGAPSARLADPDATATAPPGGMAAAVSFATPIPQIAPRAPRPAKEPETAPPEAPAAVPAEFPQGTKIGRYLLGDAIGTGGTGTVYRAFDSTTNRYVALKILAKELKDERRDRFLREIEVQANLRHPHIMPVFDRGEHEERPYFTMELLYKPFTLTDVVGLAREGTLFKYATLAPLADLRQAVRSVLVPVCDGIFVANVENGVVHRDLKPDNVLVDSRTLRAYVIDFGICHVVDRPGRRISTTVVAPTMDQTGVVGTPRFLAPEQARGSVHERTDVWGLGALLRYLVSGEPPIAPASAITRAELRRRVDALRQAEAAAREKGDEEKAKLCEEKLARLEAEDVRPLDALYEDARSGRYVPLPDGTPPELVAIVDRAMAVRPTDRYPDARALADDLQTWLLGAKKMESVGGRGPEDRRRAARRNVALIAALFGAGAVGFGLGTVLAPRGRAAVAAARADDLAADVDRLGREIRALEATSGRRDGIDGGRVYDVLQARLADLRRRLDALPPDVGAEARDRARALSERLAPARVTWTIPGDARATLFDLGRGSQEEVAPGDLSLAPGEYRLVLKDARDAVRVPIVVPFSTTGTPSPTAITIPLRLEDVPAEYVVVVGRTVEHRGAPASASAPAPVEVRTFLIDRHEVDNLRYAEFLESIGDAALRSRRVPAVGFEPDPKEAGHFRPVSGASTLPVVGVSGDDAAAYVAWRSGRENATVRLPTEAEWVLAAGGALDRVLPSGSEGDLTDPPTRAAFTPPMRPARPGAGDDADLSPYGVLRMLGNVREIVTTVGGGDSLYLVKGGAVGDAPIEAALRAVRPIAREARDDRTGFRVVREIPPR